MSRGSPISKVYPAHPPINGKKNTVLGRPPVNWITAISGLFGTDLIASGSSTGHVQLWQLTVEGKAFSFGDEGGDNNDKSEKLRGRLRIHHDKTKISRVPGGEYNLVSHINSTCCLLSLSVLI